MPYSVSLGKSMAEQQIELNPSPSLRKSILPDHCLQQGNIHRSSRDFAAGFCQALLSRLGMGGLSRFI